MPMIDGQLASLRRAYAGRLHADAADMAPYLTDWRGKWSGAALAVALPGNTAEVAQLMAWCHANAVPVVPQGGNTGLSGASVPEVAAPGRQLPVLLSLKRLNLIRAIDPDNQTMVVEAGVILDQVRAAAAEAQLLFPLSLAAQGSCTIGGNLASNAGGVQVLRYGNARELCLGLEVVTAEGEVWDGLRALRKDNTGYDLRDLYIGSEGTLGVITAAVLKLFPRPQTQTVALVALASPQEALQLLGLARQRLGATLTAFELFSDTCLSLVTEHLPGTRRPLAEASPWYVLLEVSTSTAEAQGADAAGSASVDTDMPAAMSNMLEMAMENGWVSDAVVGTSLAQFDALWALRENISEAQGAAGKTIKHDIALPISRIPDFLAHTDAAVTAAYPQVRLVCFGHLGDGNLHYNASPAAGVAADAFTALEGPLNRLVHDAVHAFGGSISAEHGLGVLRRDEAARYKSPVEMQLMRRIKAALDPQGLMNPGKVLA